MAAARVPRAPARRAHARRRRRSAGRDLRRGARAGRLRGRRGGRGQRGGGGARPVRPGCWWSARAASCTRAPRTRSTSPGPRLVMEEARSDERAPHPPAPTGPTWRPSRTPSRPSGGHGPGRARGRGSPSGRRAAPGDGRGVRAQPRPGGRPAGHLRGRRRHGRRPVRQRRNVVTILRLASITGRRQHRHDLRDHRWRHRPVRGGDRGPRLRVGHHVRHAEHGQRHALAADGVRGARGRCGLRPGQRGADRLRQRRPVHHDPRDLASAAGWPRSSPSGRTQIVPSPDLPDSAGVQGFKDFWTADVLGIPLLVVIFALVSVAGWFLFNRHHVRAPDPGRRRQPRGAARLAGIDVRRHTVLLYVLVGACCWPSPPLMFIRPHVDRHLHPRHPAGARTSSRRRDRRDPDDRWPRHHRRHRDRRSVLIFSSLSNVFVLNKQDASTRPSPRA